MIVPQPSLLLLVDGINETPSRGVLPRSSSSSSIAETDPHGDDWEDDDEEPPPGQEDGQPTPPTPNK